MNERCVWYSISREQRGEETERHLGHDGTNSFEVRGCYDCEGNNVNCEMYLLRPNLGDTSEQGIGAMVISPLCRSTTNLKTTQNTSKENKK